MSHRFHPKKPTVALLTAAGVIVLAIAGVALARETTSHRAARAANDPVTVTAPSTPAPGPLPSALPRPAAFPSAAVDRFAVVRRPHDRSDAVPADTATRLERILPGPAVDLARKVIGGDGRTYFVLPGAGGQICVAGPTSGSCGSTAAAIAGNVIETDICVAGDPNVVRVVGLATDGSTDVTITGQDGSQTKASVRDNLYTVTLPRAAAPTSVAWRDTAGQPQQQAITLPADAVTANCG